MSAAEDRRIALAEGAVGRQDGEYAEPAFGSIAWYLENGTQEEQAEAAWKWRMWSDHVRIRPDRTFDPRTQPLRGELR